MPYTVLLVVLLPAFAMVIAGALVTGHSALIDLPRGRAHGTGQGR